jgi:hypothetical protein
VFDISQQQKILDLACEFDVVVAKLLGCPLLAGTDLHIIKYTSLERVSLKF